MEVPSKQVTTVPNLNNNSVFASNEVVKKTKVQTQTVYEILMQAKSQAFRGGIAGASAQTINVFALMWLRTTMNYQYRYGGNLSNALSTLYKEGGVPRFYRGLVPALIQSPLSRFGDTAANTGVLSLLDSSERTANFPVSVKTAMCSAGAASFRFFLMPIDASCVYHGHDIAPFSLNSEAWKTIKQVEGGDGLKALSAKVRQHGISKLYHGSVAAMSATWVGHYPWFFTFNYLNQELPKFDFRFGNYVRNASIGFVASVISDTCSNSIRVLKTTKQTYTTPISYTEAVSIVIKKDGVVGLFGRGLKTRILTNGIQGMAFSVGWRAIQDLMNKSLMK